MKRSLAVILAVAMVVEFMFLGPALAQPSLPDPEIPPEVDEDPLDMEEIREVLPDAIPANTMVPSTYLHDDFEGEAPLSGWAEDRLLGDRHATSFWDVLPMGREGSPAATLADTEDGQMGLPGWVHQALVSPTVDLTSVPSASPGQHHEQGEYATDRAVDTGTRQADEIEASKLPRSPARLVVDHTFTFPDDRSEDGSAESGFTIEARAPGGDWVPLEPAPGMETARETARPVTSRIPALSALMMGVDGVGLTLSDDGVEGLSDLVGSQTVPVVGVDPVQAVESVSIPNTFRLVDPGRIAVLVDQDCVLTDYDQRTITDGTLPMIIPGFSVPSELRESVCLAPQLLMEEAGGEAGTATPRESNAFVDPLDARGYTGTSDHTGDGEPDPVQHTFDLSPWAGSEVELRFRAGTSNADAPGAFWSIDDVRVESISQAANMRVQLAAPGEEHLAPPGEPFPIQAQVQNVGQIEQEGPFEVEVTIEGPVQTWTETLTINGTLGFLDTAKEQFTFTPTSPVGYQVHASIESLQPDGDPTDDEAEATLPVGVDDSVRVKVHRSDAVLEDGELLSGTVSVENRGNAPLEGVVDVRLHAYDPTSGGPTGEGIPLAQPVPITLPPSDAMHPLGVQEPTVEVPFEGPVTEGSHVVVAQIGDAIGTAPVGVDAPPPPVFDESFEHLSPGGTSFQMDTGTGTWDVRAESDIREGLVYAPFQRDDDGSSTMDPTRLDPGGLEEQGAWVPSAHESLVLTPTDQDRLIDVTDPLDDDDDELIFAESPRSPVSTSVLTHEVDLRGTQTAQLEYLSALSIPPDQMGATQMLVVAQPRTQASHPVTDDLRFLTGFYAEQVANALPSEDVCLGEMVHDLGEQVSGDNGPDIPDLPGLCLLIGEGITDPCEVGTQNNTVDADVTGCLASAPRWDALSPLAGGDIVHQDHTPHAWQGQNLDLSAYAGSIVDVAFVFISEADEAELRADSSRAGEDEDEGEISYATPQRLGSLFMLDQARVVTDQGLRLDPAERSMAAPPEHVPHETLSNEPMEGWRSLGYAYQTGLGASENPLRSQAQLLEGHGRPAAMGADSGTGLVIGSEEGGDTGIKLYDVEAPAPDSGDVEEYEHPSTQPVTTVVASPTIDLGGLKAPQVSFDQRFSLQTQDGQRLTKNLDGNDVLTAFELPEGTCGIQDDDDVSALTDELRCALAQKRSEDPDFDIAASPSQSVREPSVPAGMFLRVSTKTPTGWSAPQPVAPGDGYRYPVGDAGGFQPTLEYNVTWKEAFQTDLQAFTLGESRDSNSEEFDPSESEPSRFNEMPVWAGDSDVTGDGVPDWVASTVDLSPWSGEEVRLEFVLTTRAIDPVGEGLPGEPWRLDNVVVGEADTPGRLTLDELTWPSDELPALDPEYPLPVRVSATTPTGLDAPVRTTAVLQDADGCIQGTITEQTRYLDEDGRTTPMPPGASVGTEILFPPETIQGPSPWQLHIAADSARTPTIPIPAEANLQATTSMPRTGPAYDVQDGGAFEATVTSPTCDPQPRAQVVQHNPSRAILQTPATPDHAHGDIAFQASGNGIQAGPPGEHASLQSIGGLPSDGLAALVVTESTGGDAGIDTVLLRTGEDAVPIQVNPANDRLSPGTPLEVTVEASRTVHGATLELIPLDEGPRTQQGLGSISPIEPTKATITPMTEGPHLVTVVANTQDGDPAMGIASIVATQAPPVTDPILEQRTTTLSVSEGTITGLRMPTATVDPSSGLSTESRTLTANLENPGTTSLEDVTVTFQAEGERIGTEQVGTLLPGEQRAVSTVYTPLSGSTIIEVQATAAGDLEASRTIAVQALQDLGELRPVLQEDGSEGWRVDGDRILFQDEDGTAPRDTIGTLPLEGPPLTSLAEFSLVLQHDMDMEEGFDGGQALIQDPAGTVPDLGGERLQQMSPFSPVQGQALTGTMAEATELEALTGSLFEDESDLSLLLDQEAHDMLEEVWQRAGDTNDIQDIDETPVPEEACQGVDHPDKAQGLVEGGAWCEWVQPKVPYPSHRSDVWLLHVGPALADHAQGDGVFTMGSPEESDNLRIDAVTQYLFLETDDLIGPAQEAGSLTVTFDEARILGEDEIASIEVCARFISLDEPGNKERRCSGLEHGEPFNEQRDWGETTLRIQDVPQGSFDVVRLEFSLQNAGLASTIINDPFRGWFIGPVTATAGQASETWTPKDDIYETDPVQRGDAIVEQSGLVRVTGEIGGGDGGVGGTLVDSANPDGEQALRLSEAIPLIPWAPGHEHAWIDTLPAEDAGFQEGFLDRVKAVPYQLGLDCTKESDVHDKADTPACGVITDPVGMGPQVLGTSGDEHPLIERQRSIELTATEDPDRLKFEPHESGYNMDYRLVVPVDLQDATHRAQAILDLEPSTGATVTLAVRSQGTDVWETIDPICHVERGCSEKRWNYNEPAIIDLSRFVGDTAELGIRVEAPAAQGGLDVKSLTVHGGILSMLEGDLALEAWTDTSVEGQGWTIDDVRLFGRTLEANLGIHAYDSPLMVEDTHAIDEESKKERVHVHPDDWASPVRVQTFNQGPETRQVDLKAAYVQADDDVFDDWVEHPDCEVTIEPSSIELTPFATEWHEIEVTLDSISNEGDRVEECDNELHDNNDENHRLPMVRLELEPHDMDNEATRDDDVLEVPLVLDPLGQAWTKTLGSFEEIEGHEQGVHASEIHVSPTRPAFGETVTIEVNVLNVNAETSNFNAEARLFNASAEAREDPWVQLDTSEMIPSTTTVDPYERATFKWVYDVLNAWEEATLVEVEIGGLERHAWMQASQLRPGNIQFQDGACVEVEPEDGQPVRRSCATDPETFEDMPPPFVGVRAYWETPPPDGEGYAETGWTLQACLPSKANVGEDEEPCGSHMDPAGGPEANDWVTLNVVHAPDGTLATLSPDSCDLNAYDPDEDENDDCTRPTTAREPWAYVAGGRDPAGERVDVLAGTSPGAPASQHDLVLFSLTDCSLAGEWSGDDCPRWETEDRFDEIHLRGVVFHDGESDMLVNIGDDTGGSIADSPQITGSLFPCCSLTPVAPAPSQAPVIPDLSFIPEAEPKAIPFALENFGSVGTSFEVDTSLPEEEHEEVWTVTTDGFDGTMLVEPGEDARGRVIAESDISPIGTSLGTTIQTEISPPEMSQMGTSLFLPVQTQPGDHPNLVAEQVRLPERVSIGEEATVEVTIRNEGTATSQPVPLTGVARYQTGAADRLETVEDFERVPALPPGGEALAVLTWTPSEHGEATVRVAVDLDEIDPIAGPVVIPWEGQLRELQGCTLEACPNVAERGVHVEPPAIVDLSVDVTLHEDTPLIVGEPVDVELTVTNAGPAEAPRFQARLLAGVVSLLEDDPLTVDEPLPAGSTWSTTTTLIPPRSGELSLTASAFSDESIVQERRDVRSDGALAIADNTLTRAVPVIAQGIDARAPTIVDAHGIFEDGHVNAGLNVTNQGTTPAHVTISALGDHIAGTLVDANGTLTPSVTLQPGEELDGTLRLASDGIPNAGRHPVQVHVTSDQGSAHETLHVDIPARPAWGIQTAHAHAQSPTFDVPVPVTNEGNANLTLRVGATAQGLEATPTEVTLEPGQTRTVSLQASLTGPPQDGTVWAQAAGTTQQAQAPLIIEPPTGALPTLLDATVNPGDPPTLQIDAANAGTDPTAPLVTITHDNATIHETRLTMDPGATTTLNVPIDGEPGNVTVHLEDGDIATTTNVTVEDLRPRVLVDGLRVTPPSPHQGDRVEVKATLANHGAWPATVTPALFVDGEMHRTLPEPVTIPPDETQSVSFTWQAQGGERALAVSADPLNPSVVDPERGMVSTSVNVTTGFLTQGASLASSQDAQNPIPSPALWLLAASILSAAWIAPRREHG